MISDDCCCGVRRQWGVHSPRGVTVIAFPSAPGCAPHRAVLRTGPCSASGCAQGRDTSNRRWSRRTPCIHRQNRPPVLAATRSAPVDRPVLVDNCTHYIRHPARPMQPRDERDGRRGAGSTGRQTSVLRATHSCIMYNAGCHSAVGIAVECPVFGANSEGGNDEALGFL